MVDAMPADPCGASIVAGGARFRVWSGTADRVWLCLFDDAGEAEVARFEMKPVGDGIHQVFVAGAGPGLRYGLRADGRWDPENGFWFDPDKLLMDPYALEIDRPYRYAADLGARRGEGGDTARLMPKAVLTGPLPDVAPAAPVFQPGGFVYEINVRGFTMKHPDVPAPLRGTVAALAHPAVLDHLTTLGVDAVELMPVTAWIDERHLAPLGLKNVWGYNPVTFMALDPRLCPGGVAELRETVAALRRAGIGVILDLVFNHTGESDVFGPTLSFRGLDNLAYYRHLPGDPVVLANDTGCGNTLATQHPEVHRMILDSLRHFVTRCGVDGFRFDLAPVLGRDHRGFDPAARIFGEIAADPVLGDRVLIAEPWDIGPGGYHLGNFPSPFLEWNDVYRDDLRRFWRGDAGRVPALATRLAGSSDVFGRNGSAGTRSVNFIAAHDGMSLADIVAYQHKHNEANGEGNRDGHDENLSWNNGVEGETDEPAIRNARARNLRALLSTLFLSRGTIMLTAGDEFGRTQHGNNNAYAQDNGLAWLDWESRHTDLQAHAGALAALRRNVKALRKAGFLTGKAQADGAPPDVEWLAASGRPLDEAGWNDAANRRLAMVLAAGEGGPRRVALLVNGEHDAAVFTLPAAQGCAWRLIGSAQDVELRPHEDAIVLAGRAAAVLCEIEIETSRRTGD
jgi:glycogen operon protein